MSKIIKNTIKRANTLNESHYRLKEVTQRVLALAIEQAQEIKQLTGQDLIKAGTKTIVVADYYAKVYGVDRDTAYTALKVAMDDLYQAEYHWKELDQDGNINEYRTRFVSHIGYLGGQGAVEFCLTEQARHHILNLTKNFTWYEIRQLSQLGKYSIRLYEILCQYRSTGKLIIGIDELRYSLGLLKDDYTDMSNFKRKVLDFAIGEVLKFTDIEKLEYEQEKQGRTIVGFKFSFRFKAKEKPKTLENKDPNTIDIFDNMTDKERSKDNELVPRNDTERQIVAEKNAYADSIGATELHRQNLIKQALQQHRQAEQQAKDKAEQEQAYRQAQKAKDKANLELAKQQYERIVASSELINAYIANNGITAEHLSGLQKDRYEKGNFKGVFEMEKYKFENLHYLQHVNLKFLEY